MATNPPILTRSGADNGGVDKRELYLKMFAGEILKTFDEKALFLRYHRVKTVSAGKEWQFPAIGTAAAVYHEAGKDILDDANGYLNDIQLGERIIKMDQLLMSNVMVPSIDEMLAHFETRSEFARQLGEAQANKVDKQLARLFALAARTATPTITGQLEKIGFVKTEATLATSAAAIADALFECAQQFDEKDVPVEGRHAVLTPALYYLLVREPRLLDIDQNVSRNSGMDSGTVRSVAGIQIHKSNHIDQGPVAAEVGEENTYAADMTNTVGLVFQEQALATVKRMGLRVETQWHQRHQAYLTTTAQLVGHGILRPECAAELKVA